MVVLFVVVAVVVAAVVAVGDIVVVVGDVVLVVVADAAVVVAAAVVVVAAADRTRLTAARSGPTMHPRVDRNPDHRRQNTWHLEFLVLADWSMLLCSHSEQCDAVVESQWSGQGVFALPQHEA